MRFEWDPAKAQANLAKHGVSFEDATTVFGDPLSLAIPNPLHSDEEERAVIMGMSTHLKLLVVVHADRGQSVRIISARPGTRSERKNYEEGI